MSRIKKKEKMKQNPVLCNKDVNEQKWFQCCTDRRPPKTHSSLNNYSGQLYHCVAYCYVSFISLGFITI